MKNLLILTNTMNQGGAESFLMKIYREIDKSKYQFDFYIMGNVGYFDDEIRSLGGKIFYKTMKTTNFRQYKSDLKSFMKNNNYSFVFRSIAFPLAALDLYYAKKYLKPKNTIVRSTIALNSKSFFGRAIQILTNSFSNIKIAPSTEAGIYMFGRRLVKKNKVHILINGIDTKKFVFDLNLRLLKRNELGIEDGELLFIHIGRFSEQKNHSFLFKIFNQILIQAPNSKLICIGEGVLESTSKKILNELNIEKSVFIYNKIPNVETFLNAADLMIFPSIFEGLPNVVMEAQGASLPVVASNTITNECKVTDLVEFLPLNDVKEWAESCLKIAKHYKENLILREKVKFPEELDIKKIADRFVELVFKE